jgi:hypothetical protein
VPAGHDQQGRESPCHGHRRTLGRWCVWFQTGAGTRKGTNLARDALCTLSLATQQFDLVVEGEVHTVAYPATGGATRWSVS